MHLCSRFTEYALRFNMISEKLLTIPKEELKLSY